MNWMIAIHAVAIAIYVLLVSRTRKLSTSLAFRSDTNLILHGKITRALTESERYKKTIDRSTEPALWKALTRIEKELR